MQKKIIEVFRSSLKEGAYLYLEKGKPQLELPEALRKQLGTLISTVSMLLTEDKQLAKTSGKEVLEAIAENGFYLQYSPEKKDDYMQKIPNCKMSPNR